MRRTQVAILGSSKAITTKKAYDLAYQVGKDLAKQGIVVLTGGGMGVMEAALKGAKSENGTTLAIVPWENPDHVNKYADIVVATGIGWSRNSINLNSADGAIIIGGGAGTLNEATYGYMQAVPMVALTTSGGTAKDIGGKYLDGRKTLKIIAAKTASEASTKIQKLIKERKRKTTELDKALAQQQDKNDWQAIVEMYLKEQKGKKKK